MCQRSCSPVPVDVTICNHSFSGCLKKAPLDLTSRDCNSLDPCPEDAEQPLEPLGLPCEFSWDGVDSGVGNWSTLLQLLHKGISLSRGYLVTSLQGHVSARRVVVPLHPRAGLQNADEITGPGQPQAAAQVLSPQPAVFQAPRAGLWLSAIT